MSYRHHLQEVGLTGSFRLFAAAVTQLSWNRRASFKPGTESGGRLITDIGGVRSSDPSFLRALVIAMSGDGFSGLPSR
ncbi:hypothetical protein E1193_21090 [Micromonospora sp. KC606]|uniref:hypothetical protein n=1 Tax=Micromonospora sp. KC606 TaxID=2530379 RepID=UPI001046F805|nr:hypothetical protein [Micromonospora sp. KC606]TDC78255.1 hypothetical protein E1193_21090 [Micromonospora sp. KC606]